MIDTVDFDNSAQYTLSLRLGTEGFAFSVFNPSLKDGNALVSEDWPVDVALPLAPNLKRAFAERTWLSCPFRQVNVLFSTRRFTLMPLELFEDEQAEAVFYYNHSRQSCEEVRYNVLHSNNLVVLFGVDRAVSDVLCEHHPGARFFAQASPLLDGFAVKSRRGNTRKMYVYVQSERIDVFCYDQGHLLLGNSYVCTQDSDRLYYLLYVWTTLGFDQERDELHLCGCVAERDAWLSGLRQFVRQVFVMPASANVDFQMITACE